MIKAELLQDATDAHVKRFLTDPNWVWQEKHNGDRRLVEKNGNVILDYNRSGDKGKGLSLNVINALRAHPAPRFVIDCEFVGAEDKIYIFDALHLNDEAIVGLPYSTRLSYLHSNFDGYHQDCPVIQSAKTPQEKLALMEFLIKIFGEGFVMKDLTAIYRPGLRENYRFKFIKTLDAVVIGDSTERNKDGLIKNSYRIGLYNERGELQDICGVTKKAEFRLLPGDVVQIMYLYGTLDDFGRLNDVVQPRIDITVKQPRTDKKPHECLISQIVVNKNFRRKR